jgi:hypothetical protein
LVHYVDSEQHKSHEKKMQVLFEQIDTNLLFIGFVVHLLRDFEQNCEENGGFVGDFELWMDFDFFE